METSQHSGCNFPVIGKVAVTALSFVYGDMEVHSNHCCGCTSEKQRAIIMYFQLLALFFSFYYITEHPGEMGLGIFGCHYTPD